MNLTAQTLNLLTFFFPGLIASAVLNVARPRGSADGLQRLIEAILFTVTIAAIVPLLLSIVDLQTVLQPLTLETERLSVRPGGWPTFALSTVLAVLLPLPIAAILSRDRHMRLLRWLRISDRSSRESTWSQVFGEQGDRFVVVHLNDGRRLQGYPMYYSETQEEGVLYLDQPAWIVDDIENENEQIAVETDQHGVLIHRTEFQLVEFQRQSLDRKRSEATTEDTSDE